MEFQTEGKSFSQFSLDLHETATNQLCQQETSTVPGHFNL